MKRARVGNRDTFSRAYREALTAYVAQGAGETALMAAYALGRRAVEEQRSILDMAALHQNTMLDALHGALGLAEQQQMALGETFFAEVMGPFEMMHRGYGETIKRLRELNATLEQRVSDRTRQLQESEQRNARLTRLYAILSGINSAIVRLRDRDELFQEACRITVNHGGFVVAWIAMRHELELRPAAWCTGPHAESEHDRSTIERFVAQVRGAAERVLNEKAAVVERSPPAQFATPGPGGRDCCSFAMLPLTLAGRAIGVFAIYSTDPASFDEDEMRLLNELAGDISFALEHIAKEEQLSYFAYYDALTALPNATLLLERLARQIPIAQRDGTLVALVLLDMERFSNINDTFGRHVGDDMLKQIGARLKRELEEKGDTVARVVADRFAVMLTNLPDETHVAHKLENHVLRIFDHPFLVGVEELHLSAQAGISVYPNDAASADALYKNAEIALKRAQHENERYLVFDPTMNERIVRTVTLEAKLRRAIERDELLVWYQPKVATDTGRIAGLEALVRYADPELGIISPVQFVPLLEETGMIIEAGAWVIRRATDDYRRWRAQGLKPPRIAVNVSAIQLRHKDFLQSLVTVAKALEGLDDDFGLDIELTESTVMQEVEENIIKLDAARRMGFHVAIDDFGTGYSSLSYLSKLPVNALKIDRSFIITMAESPSSLAIVTTIISLAHALGMVVIAEGVEQEDQAKLLRLLRCEQIQGNLYNRAMPADQVASLLARAE